MKIEYAYFQVGWILPRRLVSATARVHRSVPCLYLQAEGRLLLVVYTLWKGLHFPRVV